MPSDRGRFRGTVLSEDPRTERFFRELLGRLGFNKNKLRYRTAPKGRGDAKAWIRAESQYPTEVTVLRRRRGQNVFLITILDGDNTNPTTRKAELDHSLTVHGLRVREDGERIAIPVPTWSIETWLLALLGNGTVTELQSRKFDFERLYRGREEGTALRDAAQAWSARAEHIPSVPSLADSKSEVSRLD